MFISLSAFRLLMNIFAHFSRCPFNLDVRPREVRAYEGKAITLQCQNQGPQKFEWKDCRWTRESDGATCFFKSKKMTSNSSDLEVLQFCNGSLDSSKIEFTGLKSPHTTCGIKFKSIFKEDESFWRCNIDYYDNLIPGDCTAGRRRFTRVGGIQDMYYYCNLNTATL